MFREMSEGRRQLERSMFLQNELSRTALDAPGMEPLADRLAELLDRPVMVVDQAFQPLASARWPAACEPGRHWLRPADGSADRGAGGPASAAGAGGAGGSAGPGGAGPAGPPRVAPIAVGRHFGGHLAVLEASRPLDAIDMHAIEQAATIFALEMLREQSAYEAESRIKGNLLEDLFTGAWQTDAEAAALLRRLGYTLDGACRVARLDAITADASLAPAGRWREQIQRPESRLYAAFSQACEQIWGSAAVAPWRSGFLALLPADPGQADRDVKEAATLLAQIEKTSRAIAPGLGMRLALGGPADGAAHLSRSLEEAERALTVSRRLQLSDRPVFFEHLGVYRVLLGPNDASHHRGFAEEILGGLLRHDAKTGSELVATLRCWVAADHSVVQAAARLYVHPNTVKYRLRRIRELVGGDPSRGDLRLQIELALKILDLPQLELDAPG
jgi:purine catabolism regulator